MISGHLVSYNADERAFVLAVEEVLKSEAGSIGDHVTVRLTVDAVSPPSEEELLFFLHVEDGRLLLKSDPMWWEPIHLRDYYAALTAKNDGAALRRLLLDQKSSDDVKRRIISFLCAEVSPEPGTEALERPAYRPRQPDRSEENLEALKTLVEREDLSMAVSALAGYGFLTKGGDPSPARRLLQRSLPEVNFRLCATLLKYWPDLAAGVGSSAWDLTKLHGYDPAYAASVLAGCALPLSDIERVLLCFMIEDSSTLPVPSLPFPDRERLVAETARGILHAELGLWLPFDRRLAAEVALGRHDFVMVQKLCHESAVPLSGRWTLVDAETINLELTNLSTDYLVFSVPDEIYLRERRRSSHTSVDSSADSTVRLDGGSTVQLLLLLPPPPPYKDPHWLWKELQEERPIWFRFRHNFDEENMHRAWVGYLKAKAVQRYGNEE